MGKAGKTIEEVKVARFHGSQVLTSNTATFGDRVDTKGYDSAMIEINVGILPSPCTLSAILYEQETNNGDQSLVPVTGANLGVISSSNAQSIVTGAIETKNYKRYLALRLQGNTVGGANPTIGISATVHLSRADVVPVDNTPVFDVDGTGN